MSLRLQVVIAIGAIAAILCIGNLVRIRRLELKYALIWFLVGILLLIFDLFPGLLQVMTQALGITLPINMLTFLGLLFVLMILFSQTIVISNLTRKCQRLTQEVGLLYKKVDDLKTEQKNNDLS
ncbi:MAG: DUF2304 domain-containing protein [Pseudobutyrivibrio sp.]|nr:DUF2304 domain-containing protein [Pseudobutyrivibrio sp.]